MTATSLTPWQSQGVLLVDWTWIVIKGQDHKDKRGGLKNVRLVKLCIIENIVVQILVVYIVDNVLVSGVEEIIWMKFVLYAVMKLKNHSLMIQIQLLSLILQIFSTHLHNPSTIRIPVSYVGTMLIMVTIVHLKFRLSTIKTRVSVKTLIIIFHKLHQVFHNNNFLNQNFSEPNLCYSSNSSETFQCQPLNQNFCEPNLCYSSNCSGFDQYQPPQYTVIHQPPQETSVEIVQARENLMKSIQTFLKKFNRISFRETPKVLLLAWEKFFEIQHAFKGKQHQPEDIQELLHKLLKDLQIIKEELAEYINSPSWNYPAFYDDDEYTIQYREYLENSSKAIAPVLLTEEPDNSLSMGGIKDLALFWGNWKERNKLYKSMV
ncbi:hypothetical protein Tco_0877261 [Tanacetum coccineum]|uniref:Uncharacterized protein n=1 Tax=Tanacetum coccineum TaxID=301880 RepID=A0ABQ5BUL4_9ASTR